MYYYYCESFEVLFCIMIFLELLVCIVYFGRCCEGAFFSFRFYFIYFGDMGGGRGVGGF